MPAPDDDWRLQGQERYLHGAAFHRAFYRAPRPEWDHDHCKFCYAKFMEGAIPDTLQQGYTTDDEKHWVCPTCFDDFRERFQFVFRS